ncbi:hypothetical protein SO694_00045288 [Aureococcus anophagefferens]|uniref:Uncharacterized protein n=1 Tax=Aureococcus anophagefferens TaxID=44056 RepID=A0ABR1G844_AURAN
MALARAARRRLLPRGAHRPTSRGAVTTTFLPENREWHEPAVLSAAAASFRDDELRLLDALAQAAAASLDRAVEASAAEACLEASVAAAGDGDAAALLADFAARGDSWARGSGRGRDGGALAAGETLRLAYAARFAERVAVALFPPGGDRYGAPARRAAARSARAAADAGAAALLEPAAAAPSAAASPRLGAKATDEFFPEHAKLGKELATAPPAPGAPWRSEHEEVTSAYLTGAFCLFCAAADAIMVA